MYEKPKDNLEGEQLKGTAELGTFSAAFLSTASSSHTERGFRLGSRLIQGWDGAGDCSASERLQMYRRRWHHSVQ
jgi:hypothetical protein